MTKLAALAVLAVALFVCASPGEAAIYLLIPNIQGEVTEQNHTGWVEVQSLNWSHSEAPAGAPVKVQFSRVIFTKNADSTSAALALAAVDQHPVRDVKMEIVRSFTDIRPVVFRMKLTNARLVSYSASAQSNNVPNESLAWEFDTITWISFKIGPNGTTSPGSAGCWDVVGNKSCPPSF